MRIGFEAKRLFLNDRGLGNYARNLLYGLVKYHPDHEYYLYTPRVSNEYVSPGLMASNAVNEPAPEPEPEEEEDDGFVAPPPPGTVKSFPYPDDGKIRCPYCNKMNWVEQQNKNKVIAFVPMKQYATKYYCKDCRGEWDFS